MKQTLISLIAVPLLVFAMPAMAADTTETWDVGATDVDFYTGFDGLGLAGNDQAVYSSIMLGYGIIQDFSAYLTVGMGADGHIANGYTELNFGIFGTPVDTRHFDLDLFMDFGISGAGLTTFVITPGLEMNYDYAPDMIKWGLYLRVNPPIQRPLEVTITLGTYWVVKDGHQLLLEFDTDFYPSDRKTVIGGLALGYNVCLTKGCGIEMINQVYFDIPQSDKRFNVGLMTGFIATLPSVK